MTIMSMLVAKAIGRKKLSQVFSTSAANASINVSSLPGYIAGKTDVTITVDTGVILYGSGGIGLTITGGATGDTIKLVNNGYIVGASGPGGPSSNSNIPGGNGTHAISIGYPITIDNQSGYIGGGGGGGGNAGYVYSQGGDGAGGNSTSGVGSAGGSYPGGQWSSGYAGGGGGGWGGAGGTGWSSRNARSPATGGAGGARGQRGGDGVTDSNYFATACGAAGYAIALNGKSVTWVNGTASSSRSYGAIA